MGHVFGDADRFQRVAVAENGIADTSHPLTDADRGQISTIREGKVSYALHALRDDDGGQSAAVKGRTSDRGHTPWDGDGCQALAKAEGKVPNTLQTFGKGDGSHIEAFLEGGFADACHLIFDTFIGHGFWNRNCSSGCFRAFEDFRLRIGKLVPDAIDFYRLGTCHQ